MSSDNINDSDTHIQKLPLELIANIVQYLSVRDIITLTSVSKIWRCTYINQNVIWKRVCQQLDIHDEDHLRNSPIFCTRISSSSKDYMDFRSTWMFGSLCHWWDTFKCYHRILKYLRTNGYCVVKVPHMCHVSNTYCIGDYIVNVGNKRSDIPVTIIILKGLAKDFHNIPLQTCELFHELFYKHIKSDKPKVVGNDKFLVIEIRSVIFVYTIENFEFNLDFSKVIQKNSNGSKGMPSQQFLKNNNDTKIAISEDKLAIVHPKENTIFLIDLNTGNIYKEIQFSDVKCYVDCVEFYKERVMVGITTSKSDIQSNDKHMAIIYNLENSTELTVDLHGAANQFKVSESVIGIQNKPHETAFVKKKNNSIFWMHSSSFVLDPYGKYIFYVDHNVLYQYIVSDMDLTLRSMLTSSIQNSSCLQLINNQFLLLNKTSNIWYDVFDVKNKVVVKSIKYDGYSLVYVGRRYIVMANSKFTLIMGYD